MTTIASIIWPDGTHTKVWTQNGCDLAFWTGAEQDFPAVVAEFEQHPGEAQLVGIDLVDLRLDLLETHDEQMVDSDRDLLGEIDALLETVRAAPTT